jgi:hypothetical protein
MEFESAKTQYKWESSAKIYRNKTPHTTPLLMKEHTVTVKDFL